MNNKKLLGKRIKEIRRVKGYTQEQLAELIDIEPCSLSAIEIGRHFPSLITVEKIADILGVRLNTLFEFDNIKSRETKIEEIKNSLEHLPTEKIDFIHKFLDFYRQ